MQLALTQMVLTLVNVRMDTMEMGSIVQVGYLLKLIFDRLDFIILISTKK